MVKTHQACLLATALFVAMPAADAAAQDYADVEVPGTIRVIVAYSAGGSSDALARVLLPYWERAIQELSGQSTSAVVVNLPGAGGEVGFTALANADPDGSTVGIINLPSVGLLEAARETAFAPWLERFEPIGVNVIDPNIIMLGEHSQHESLEAAVQAAIDNPGSVIIGADGPLSDDHLAMYALESETGADFTFIPYAGGAPANRAFRTGETDINLANVFDYLQSEDVTREAAVFLDERYEMVEDVPTLEERIGVHVGNLGSTRGLAAPAGVPEDLLELYREAFRIAVEDEEYQQAAVERNITIVRPRVGEEFGQIMQEQDDLVEDLLQYFIEGGFIEAGGN